MTDIEKLDNYLSSNEAPEGCMMISDLDGFLHGIVCSPVAIEPQEWFPVALGVDARYVPEWVIEETLGLFHEIELGLAEEPPELGPIFWKSGDGEVIAMDWAEGFMEAVSLRHREWLRLTESGTHGYLMAPIMLHVMDEHGNSAMGVAQEDMDTTLDAAADQIPNAIAEIYRFWNDKSSVDKAQGQDP